ncbi:MAG TPA: hypothetical protein VFS82_04030 [Lysobacter sp.]|nr:hypothetical protein [Lysobacter sp.]
MIAIAALPAAAFAAESKPEIDRAPAAPQAVGAAHTLRTIPEACARLEGVFTGVAADPYRFAVVRTSPTCQPRARFLDAVKAQPSLAEGWVLNDLIRVPNAGCASQLAVVHVWRKPGQAAPPELDAQGRARIYLDDSMQAKKADPLSAVTMFSAAMAVEGKPCS